MILQNFFSSHSKCIFHFQKKARALAATEETNCVVDFLLEAHQHALELRKVPLEYRGPLYGLPISVKECFFVKGCDATIGLARNINSPAQEDGGMIKVSKGQKAKTNFILVDVMKIT